MPLVEYQCRDCGSRFERLQWNSSDSTAGVQCGCGSQRLERILYSRVSIATASAPAADACQRPQGCCGGGACGVQ